MRQKTMRSRSRLDHRDSGEDEAARNTRAREHLVQLAAYQLIGRNGITGTTRAWSLHERVPLPEVQAPTAEADVDGEVAGLQSTK